MSSEKSKIWNLSRISIKWHVAHIDTSHTSHTDECPTHLTHKVRHIRLTLYSAPCVSRTNVHSDNVIIHLFIYSSYSFIKKVGMAIQVSVSMTCPIYRHAPHASHCSILKTSHACTDVCISFIISWLTSIMVDSRWLWVIAAYYIYLQDVTITEIYSLVRLLYYITQFK